MGHKHSKDELLAGALGVALEEGLSSLTFGRLAARLGTSDRMIVYYFPSKDDLVTDVLQALGNRLLAALAGAFARPASGHIELARRAWPTLATDQLDPMFALFFEANGLAAAGRQPYARLVAELVEAWTAWLAGCFTGTAARRRAEAQATIALVDGLLLVRLIAGGPAAERAARALGVAGR